jgi:hypothetical protein
MSGVVTDTRTLDDGRYVYHTRFGLDDYVSNVGYYNPETQTTTSFRTKGGADPSEDTEIADARRIFRNGFSSYDPQYDHGHEFFTTRTKMVTSHPYWEGWRPLREGVYTGYKGPLIVMENPSGNYLPEFPPLRRISETDAKSYGTRAISATIPTSPQASLSTLLGEVLLDGGLPYLGSKLAKPHTDRNHSEQKSVQEAGSDYLNAQFGWLPIVSDVKKLVSSLLGANATIKQLVRDSGKNVRRRFVFPPVRSFTSTETIYGGSPWANVHRDLVEERDGTPSVTTELSLQREVWFKGCFTYFIASGDSVMDKLEHYEQLGNKLLGSRLNAEALWELAPWSWLIDWQSTIGVALGNASKLSEDGLVLRYGYLMSKTTDIKTCTTHNLAFRGGTIGHTSTQFRRVTKERIRATPFGFGLDLSTLSAKQWSILAALGMTKGSGALRLTS